MEYSRLFLFNPFTKVELDVKVEAFEVVRDRRCKVLRWGNMGRPWSLPRYTGGGFSISNRFSSLEGTSADLLDVRVSVSDEEGMSMSRLFRWRRRLNPKQPSRTKAIRTATPRAIPRTTGAWLQPLPKDKDKERVQKDKHTCKEGPQMTAN